MMRLVPWDQLEVAHQRQWQHRLERTDGLLAMIPSGFVRGLWMHPAYWEAIWRGWDPADGPGPWFVWTQGTESDWIDGTDLPFFTPTEWLWTRYAWPVVRDPEDFWVPLSSPIPEEILQTLQGTAPPPGWREKIALWHEAMATRFTLTQWDAPQALVHPQLCILRWISRTVPTGSTGVELIDWRADYYVDP